ncbi:MarR family winged helix-turn-helix transcriptional regulator [Sphingomonas sp. NSE70-1]|uniref:MarR family winged helix-turn-helix transcriptional regulator n=1 Tax=Sphingomonas caseinilyticus TaxID=2908205 RepID=A0ABT0RT05_9SPHN|nr:MarR family winged helix-turn-helix transcriptional regulator [Sphingomonas caseinilyticus]MCL6698061.1 MarR family winged helix-turn-helix transcriptional regulator [Sphingomonas caseinilyticus]
MTAESGGFRAVAVPLEEAAERIELQPQASAIWLELDRDLGPELDHLLDKVEANAVLDQCPAVITSPLPLIDRIMARVTDPSVEMLIDPSVSERATALALAMARRSAGDRLYDITKEPGAIRLQQLSDEVSRIAATLARLSVVPKEQGVEMPVPATGDVPAVSLDMVRQVIRARRLRSRFFDEELFADPAWDMLLDLLQAEIAQHRVPVSSLCIAAAVPPTTALRWIKTMTDLGLFNRRADPHDGRRIFVELSAGASQAMRRYFGEVGRLAPA